MRDALGEPLEATVTVLEIRHHHDEDWRSRVHDGRFDRFLPGPGEWTLRAEAPGYAPVERCVVVGEGERVDVELLLEAL